ncbi:hypothetical protein [Parageobacillus sp. KH3-4]|uniref:hypothetical protein n=1 Tax=Parageobacillus sp. KH3-4 TaxID=2916802 RepID=UPI001FCB6680|nr:hypothetical protein [Parageobacillus sp. KH3-4]BDG48953.1 hypothetical protein PspKH34_35140 [Parageobacillus sp. KH3-4]
MNGEEMVCDRRKGHDEIKKGNGKANIYKILWLLPIVFSIHNMEELLFLEEWAKEVFAGRSWMFFARLYESPNLEVAMLLLT